MYYDNISVLVYCIKLQFLLCVLILLVQERNLALSTEGVKMTMASERPYFLALDDNSLGAGVTLYHLKART